MVERRSLEDPTAPETRCDHQRLREPAVSIAYGAALNHLHAVGAQLRVDRPPCVRNEGDDENGSPAFVRKRLVAALGARRG